MLEHASTNRTSSFRRAAPAQGRNPSVDAYRVKQMVFAAIGWLAVDKRHVLSNAIILKAYGALIDWNTEILGELKRRHASRRTQGAWGAPSLLIFSSHELPRESNNAPVRAFSRSRSSLRGVLSEQGQVGAAANSPKPSGRIGAIYDYWGA